VTIDAAAGLEWVISGHRCSSKSMSTLPRKPTSFGAGGMSAECHRQT
jgi:hypothetical protein